MGVPGGGVGCCAHVIVVNVNVAASVKGEIQSGDCRAIAGQCTAQQDIAPTLESGT
jgi:hypothetical protein